MYRKKKIIGYVADGSGNVIPNAQVVLKRVIESGSVTVDSIKSGVSGFFESKHLPAGVYEVYESGVFSQFIDHSVSNYIPCYSSLLGENRSDDKNYNFSFIRIELESNFFPTTDIVGADIKKFYTGVDIKEITHGSFDVEYYDEASKVYVKWAGVRGVKDSSVGKVHLPLDYMSMVFKSPKSSSSMLSHVTTHPSSPGKVVVTIPEKVKPGDVIEIVDGVKFHQYIYEGSIVNTTAGIQNGKGYLCSVYKGSKYDGSTSLPIPTTLPRLARTVNIYPSIDVSAVDDVSVANKFTVTESPITGAKRELYNYPA